MRIVTRPDFDGIVCAVLLRIAEEITSEIYWVEPNDIQADKADIKKGDILANLPYSQRCSLWFDHHISNKPDIPFDGAFSIAPSAARVIYTYYQEKGVLDNRFDELMLNTDIIDAAKLDRDQVLHPEKYPYILLSMTLRNDKYKDIPYWNRLIELLMEKPIEKIMTLPDIKSRCDAVVQENEAYAGHLKRHTKVSGPISVTDFRGLDPVPHGNRFLSYSLFPESQVSLKIRYDSPKQENVLLSVGKSIFTPGCQVNIGRMLSNFGGGGHDGAGGCTLAADAADQKIDEILEILSKNTP